MLPDRLVEEVKDLELSTARKAVHRVLAIFKSHYQGLDRMEMSGGWAPGISDKQCDELEEDCIAFTCDMADAALKGLDLLPEDAPEDLRSSRPLT
jgi:hypothetical protein